MNIDKEWPDIRFWGYELTLSAHRPITRSCLYELALSFARDRPAGPRWGFSLQHRAASGGLEIEAARLWYLRIALFTLNHEEKVAESAALLLLDYLRAWCEQHGASIDGRPMEMYASDLLQPNQTLEPALAATLILTWVQALAEIENPPDDRLSE